MRIKTFLILLILIYSSSSYSFDFFSSFTNQDSKYSGRKDYKIRACQKFSSSDENSRAARDFALRCVDGKLTALTPGNRAGRVTARFFRDARNISSSIVQDLVKEDYKNFIVKTLRDKVESLESFSRCATTYSSVPLQVEQTCKQSIEAAHDISKTYIKPLRAHMAIMSGRNYRVNKNISHLQSSVALEPLSQLEVSNTTIAIDASKQAFEQAELLKLKRLGYDHIEENANGVLEIIGHSQTANNIDIVVKGKTRAYRKKQIDHHKEEYSKIIDDYPILSFYPKSNVPDDAKAFAKNINTGVLQDIVKTKELILSIVKNDYEIVDFFAYEDLLNSYFLNDPSEDGLQKAKCSIAESLHFQNKDGGLEDMVATAGLVAGGIGVGLICAGTGGLGCLLGVGLVEGIAISGSALDLADTTRFSRVGLIEHQNLENAQNTHLLNIFAAPTGLIGTGLVRSARLATVGKFSVTGVTKQRFLTKVYTSPKENRAWIQAARSNKKGLYFDVDNGALKRLNDTLKDKELVTSLTNMHKELISEQIDLLLRKYPGIKLSKYSDFKTQRFFFEEPYPSGVTREILERDLGDVFSTANRQLNDYVSNSPGLGIPDNEVASHWFNAGFGVQADQASLASRAARVTIRNIDNNTPRLVNFSDVEEVFSTRVSTINMRQKELSKILQKDLLTDVGDGVNIPNVEVFEFLRKNTNLKGNELAEAFNSHFNNFDSSINGNQANILSSYFKEVDSFSPGLWIEKRVSANLSDAVHGGVSVDIRGMGAKNVFQVASDLASHAPVGATPANISDVITSIRRGEESVTSTFEQMKGRYEQIIARIDSSLRTRCSGDDCVTYSESGPILPEVRDRIQRALTTEFDSPTRFRMTSIAEGVSSSSRTQIAVQAELVEKGIRKKTRNAKGNALGISQEILESTTIRVDVPSFPNTRVGIVISPAEGVTLTRSQRTALGRLGSDVIREVNIDAGQSDNLGIILSDYEPLISVL